MTTFEEGKLARLGLRPLIIPFIVASKPEFGFLHTVGTKSPSLVKNTVREISITTWEIVLSP